MGESGGSPSGAAGRRRRRRHRRGDVPVDAVDSQGECRVCCRAMYGVGLIVVELMLLVCCCVDGIASIC